MDFLRFLEGCFQKTYNRCPFKNNSSNTFRCNPKRFPEIPPVFQWINLIFRNSAIDYFRNSTSNFFRYFPANYLWFFLSMPLRESSGMSSDGSLRIPFLEWLWQKFEQRLQTFISRNSKEFIQIFLMIFFNQKCLDINESNKQVDVSVPSMTE